SMCPTLKAKLPPRLRVISIRSPGRSDCIEITLNLGGSFAFNVGHIDQNGRIHPLRLTGDTKVPILADAPSADHGFRSLNHGGGYNVLSKSLNLRFVTDSAESRPKDHPFLNYDNQHAASRCEDDIVLLRSEYTPIGRIRISFVQSGE
ncbi:MAG: hypothetical protein AAF961_08480, partial [Planctomycetota bacterium]